MLRCSGGTAVGFVGFATEAECGITFEVLGEEPASGFKFVPDHSEAVQPGAHGEFRVVHGRLLRAGALDCLGLGAQCEAELDEGPQQAAMDPVLLAIGRGQEVPAAELDGPLVNVAWRFAKAYLLLL